MTQEEYIRMEEQWQQQYDTEHNEALANKAEFKQASLSLMVSTLTMQAMIAMGKLEHPSGQSLPVNLEQARFMIDTISVLQKKCDPTMTEDEKNFLKDTLYHLRDNYLNSIP